ncbi:MAG: hypothetical protein A2145_00975 [candidate division Zixibacteria bacterium RBG_16_40_9]|nr:MAG: hypothetical protein A2145_00975 [candidate division Zixibacteria bacterium RBG_16_40_9]
MPQENEALWQACLEIIQTKIKKESFYTWFRPTKGVPDQEKILKVAVPNGFVAEWLEEHYLQLIKQVAKERLGSDLEIKFCLFKDIGEKEEVTIQAQAPENSDKISNPYRMAVAKRCPSHLGNGVNDSFNPRYTFEAFVVGENSQFARAAALAVAEAPGKTKFNPLYIYGGVGLGKTHLIQAIGHYVSELSVVPKVCYVTSEKFTNDFINSIGTSTMQKFTEFYRNIDLLLVDDIQFFAGKESTQVQFFHTFNVLYHAGKQIVLTSDRAPHQISGLEERLLSRFQWGLVTDIQPPDLETRIAIINKKLASEKVILPLEVSQFVAERFTANIRELEGALIRLLAYASISGKMVDLKLAEEVLKDSCSKTILTNGNKEVSLEQIIKKVAVAFGLAEQSLKSKSKTKELAWARQVGMYLAHKLTQYSLKSIGDKFGGRDHSTVIHACKLVEESLKKEPGLKNKLDKIINSLYH